MIELHLDQDGTGQAFDKEIRKKGPIATSCSIVTRTSRQQGGISQGPVLLIQSGSARIVVSIRTFLEAAAAIRAAHPGADDRVYPNQPAGTELNGHHRGIGWTAIHLEHMYLIRIEGDDNIHLAGNEDAARAVATGMIDNRFKPNDPIGDMGKQKPWY